MRLFIMEAVSAGSFWCKVDTGLDFDYKVRDAPFFFGRSLVVEIWMFFRTLSAAVLNLLISTLSMSSEADASTEMRKVIVRLMDIIDYVYPGFMGYTCLQHSSLMLITCRVFLFFQWALKDHVTWIRTIHTLLIFECSSREINRVMLIS